jgi:radical SAM protein with 4Fe4S-binding SPASM domain
MDMSSAVFSYKCRLDEGILFSPNTGAEIRLNESAIAIVRSLLAGQSPAEIALAISREYSVKKSDALNDIHELLQCIANPPGDSCVEIEKDLPSLPAFPFALEIELTQRCNWSCSFCYNSLRSGGAYKGAAFIDSDLVMHMLDECAEEGLLRVRYSGGEPTLHPKLNDFISRAHELGLYQIIFTNGSRLEPKFIELWHKHGVREVMLSLHGPQEIHDSLVRVRNGYSRVCSAVQLCREAGLKVVLEMTLVRHNQQFVADTMRIAGQLGVSEFRIMRYVPRSEFDTSGHAISDESFKEIVDMVGNRPAADALRVLFPCSQRYCLSVSPKPIEDSVEIQNRSRVLLGHCRAGLNWVSISQAGELRLCPHSTRGLGNLRDAGSIKSLWSQNVKPVAANLLAAGAEHCGGCVAANRCAGGCPLRNSALLAVGASTQN